MAWLLPFLSRLPHELRLLRKAPGKKPAIRRRRLEAVLRIDALFAIERPINGHSAECVRHDQFRPSGRAERAASGSDPHRRILFDDWTNRCHGVGIAATRLQALE
jgi:hypothetical protein